MKQNNHKYYKQTFNTNFIVLEYEYGILLFVFTNISRVVIRCLSQAIGNSV